MGVKIKECSQAQRNLVIDLFKQVKMFRSINKATGMDRFLSAPKVSSLLEKDFGLKVSSCTIRNRLKESGFKARVPRKKSFLSKIHRK